MEKCNCLLHSQSSRELSVDETNVDVVLKDTLCEVYYLKSFDSLLEKSS